MKKDISSITSQLQERQIAHIKDLLTPVIRQCLRSKDDGQNVISAGGYLQNRFGSILKDIKKQSSDCFSVVPDYDSSMSDLVTKCNFDNVTYNAQKWLEHSFGESKTKDPILVYLLNFPFSEGRNGDSESILKLIQKRIRKLGMRPANVRELLSLVAQYPNIFDNHFCIQALGSKFDDRYPSVNLEDLEDRTFAASTSINVDEHHFFAAVR